MQQRQRRVRRFISLSPAWLVAMAWLAPMPSMAAAWPDEKPINIIVPFAPGGFTDLAARRLANSMGTALKATVVVQNKVGASGQIGTAYVAREKPDGYTLLVSATQHVIYPAIQSKLPYNPRKDFSEIAILGYAPNLLLVPAKSPARNLQEFVELAAQQEGGMAFGSSGIGGSAHMSGELFKLTAGVNLRHVPYKSASPALADLIGSQIPSVFQDATSAAAFIRSGELRALAVTSQERLPSLPDVPTIAESGYPSYESQAWVGLFGPAGMSPAIVDRLSRLVLDSNAEAANAKWLYDNNAIPANLTPTQMTAFVHAELDKWQQVVSKAQITAQ